MHRVNPSLKTITVIIILLLSITIASYFYYNNRIAQTKNQNTNLGNQSTSLTTANLTAALSITEVPYIRYFLNGTPWPDYYPHGFSDLFLNGSVTNDGNGIAFNAGLHVVAYASNGTSEVNMTVPLVNGAWVFGTDAKTDAWVSNYYKSYLGSLQLGTLKSGQTVTFDLNFYHEGNASSWTATPVWTNNP